MITGSRTTVLKCSSLLWALYSSAQSLYKHERPLCCTCFFALGVLACQVPSPSAKQLQWWRSLRFGLTLNTCHRLNQTKTGSRRPPQGNNTQFGPELRMLNAECWMCNRQHLKGTGEPTWSLCLYRSLNEDCSECFSILPPPADYRGTKSFCITFQLFLVSCDNINI